MKTSRLEMLARSIGAREAPRTEARARARARAETIHSRIAEALGAFARAAAASGAPHLDLLHVDPVEPDDKSVRAFQIRIRRGRFQAIVVSKDRDEVMLVGPFRRGAGEEPCRAIHLATEAAPDETLDAALEDLLAALVEQSFTK